MSNAIRNDKANSLSPEPCALIPASVPSIGNHRVATDQPVDNWPHVPAMDGGE